MPTYVYGCDACGHQFERFQKFSDEPIRVCPECQHTVRRIFQPAGIVFKGSGWHVTDYKRSGSAGGSDGEDKAAKNTESKTESKAEAKSDSKNSDSTSTASSGAPSSPAAS